MKRLSFVAIFCLSGYISIAQNYLIANNNPGAAQGTTVYTGGTALQDAFAGAVDGDVIYIIPSQTNYGDLTISGKHVSLVGYGLNPEGVKGEKSNLNDITLEGVEASGTRISGIYLQYVYVAAGAGTYDQTGILIENCRLQRVIHNATNTISNSTIRNCQLDMNGHLRFYTTSNITLSHNIFRTASDRYAGHQIIGPGLNIQYNIFWYYPTATNGAALSGVTGSTIYRNIFYYTSPLGATTSTIEENLTFDPDNFDPNNVLINNIINQDPQFENFPANSTYWLDTWDITLKDGSPAIQDVNDRTKDIGPSGGVEPFDTEGNKFPLIQSLSVPTTTPAGSDMEVQIKAKGN